MRLEEELCSDYNRIVLDKIMLNDNPGHIH